MNQDNEAQTPQINRASSLSPTQASVWVVEEGEYSDYHVVGVFTSEANANRIASLTGGDVAEWPLDPNIAELNQGLQIYSVQMHKDGSVDHSKKQEIDSYGMATTGVVNIWERSKAPAFQGKGVDDVLVARVWAKDEQHAIKIANEYRAQFIASGKWK